MNARCEDIPFSIEEYTLLRLRHVPNKDACLRCDGLGTIARKPAFAFDKPIVPCPCRTISVRKAKVLKPCCPGDLELFVGDEIEVYGWPTRTLLLFNILGPGSICKGGYANDFRELLQQGFITFDATPCDTSPAP